MADGVFDHAVVGKVAAEEPDLVGAVGFVGHPDEAVGAHAEQLGAVVVAVLDAQTEPGRGPPDLAACDVQLVLLRPPLDLLQRRPAFLCQSHLALRSPKTKGYQLMRRLRANIAQRPPNIKALSVWLVRVAAARAAAWSGRCRGSSLAEWRQAPVRNNRLGVVTLGRVLVMGVQDEVVERRIAGSLNTSPEQAARRHRGRPRQRAWAVHTRAVGTGPSRTLPTRSIWR